MTMYDSAYMDKLKEAHKKSIFKKHLEENERVAFEYIQGLEDQKEELLKQLAACIYHMFDPDTITKSGVQTYAIDFIKKISGRTYEEIIDEFKRTRTR